jgi:MFS family permease
VLFPAPIVLFALAGGPLWLKLTLLISGEFFSGIGVMIFDVNSNSLSVLITPHRLRSRVVGVHRTINYGVRPIGALLGGVLGSAIGLRPTLWIGAVGGMLAVLWLIPSPIPRMRELPETAET